MENWSKVSAVEFWEILFAIILESFVVAVITDGKLWYA